MGIIEMEQPQVSVIIATHNRPDLLKKSIESVLMQSYQSFEVAVVNDCGKNVRDVVESFEDDRIKYYTNEKNSGLGFSRNVGIKNTTGKYLVMLDDDDWFLQNHLEILVRYLEGSENKIVYTDCIRNVQQKNGGDGYVTMTRDIPISLDYGHDLILVQNITPVLAVGFARSIIDRGDLFDTTLLRYEDWDTWIRLSREHPMLHIPLPTCEMRWCHDKEGNTMSSKADNLFSTQLPVVYKRYLDTAINRKWVLENMNNILNIRGMPIIVE